MSTLHQSHSLPALLRAGRGLRAFTTIWAGQLVSQFGSGLTSFALGLWVYQKSGSVTLYALIALAATLPRLLAAPLAGALVDRWDRRWTMLLADLGAGLCSLAVAVLLVTNRLEIGHIYLIVSLATLCGAFQSPAYSASVTLLASKEQLGRASGLMQLSQAAADISAPLAAGVLIKLIQVQGILVIDFATFLVAVGTLLAVRIPRPSPNHPDPLGKGARLSGFGALRHEAAQGWQVIAQKPGLVALLVLSAVFNFQWGMVSVLAAPLVLSFSDASGLGLLLTLAGSGMLAGSLAMSAWGGPRRRIAGILQFEALSGLCFILIGLRPSLALVAVGAVGAHLTIAVISGSSRVVWQRQIAPHLQGRVFAIQDMVAHSMAPLAIVAAGPLAEGVFQPLLAPQGSLANSLGLLLGTGPGRGIGLMFVVMGLVQAGLALAGALYRPMRSADARSYEGGVEE
jgi:MFS transporter, DHA3 family, macrolide efflux protein